ncbi:HalOD1 output domain-containing protein [Natrialba sp. SSL1]|uniref:HalOD1 output domain-containing protein n=1 Tax=Natrialba sp. SSL1 TaxID=1869245 RepID=UPI0008F883AF|nr:hypothetical protein BBD46_17360 [Natrialba sp. SSL1]
MSSPDDTSPPGSGLEGAVSPSQAIIEAVAAREGVDPTEIEPPAYEPLYSVINPEALDSLFRDTTHGSHSHSPSHSHSHSQETQVDSLTETPSQSGTGVETEVEDEDEAETGTEAETKTKPEAGAGTGTDTETGTKSTSQPGSHGHVELEYEGYVVTVYSDGRVALEDSTPDDSVGAVDT